MDTNTSPHVIVCAVDLGSNSAAILEHAIVEASRFDSARVHCLTVVEDTSRRRDDGPAGLELEDIESQLRSRTSDVVARVVGDSEPARDRTVEFHVRCGLAAEEIVDLAFECHAHSIILGRHQKDGVHRRLPGGIPSRVLRDAPCSVVVVHPPNYEIPAPPPS